jgi:hypothetical protein
MTNQEKLFVSLRKYFLATQDKLAKYKAAGINPPEYLLKNFEDAKRQLDAISETIIR